LVVQQAGREGESTRRPDRENALRRRGRCARRPAAPVGDGGTRRGIGVFESRRDGKSKQTLRHLPAKTRSALGKEANKVRSGQAETRKEREAEARRLEISGRSKMGKDELRRALARAR
jgi:hypothetical protein